MSNARKIEDGDDSYVDELAAGTELLHGQFKIEKFLNAGGFGITYLAKDSLDRRVVIKECFPSSFCHRSRAIVEPRSRSHTKELASVVDLFVQEARSLSKLNHPNIVGVHQVFEDNNTAYMVLDFVEGRDLLDTLEDENHGLTPPQIKGLLTDILGAIDYVHGQDILHRDISPDNILIDSDLRPVLIDFGAAREEATKKSRVLSALRVVKDGYSPQEFYIQGSKQTPSSDLYALGATFYHLIDGGVPANSQARLAAIASGEKDIYQPLVDRVKGYDKKVLQSIDKALGILPKDRLQSAQEWLDMLEGKGRKSRILTTPVPVSSAAAATAAAEKKDRSKLVPLLGSAAVIAILAVIGVVGSGALKTAEVNESAVEAVAAAPALVEPAATETQNVEAARLVAEAQAAVETQLAAAATAAQEAEAANSAEAAVAQAQAAAEAELAAAAAAAEQAAVEAELAAATAKAEQEAEATRLAEVAAAEARIALEAGLAAATAQAEQEAQAVRLLEAAAAEAQAALEAEATAIAEQESAASFFEKITAAEADIAREAELVAAAQEAQKAEAARLAEVAVSEAQAARQAEELRLAAIAAAETAVDVTADTGIQSTWLLELPFTGQSGSNVIETVSAGAPAWALEGTQVVAVNGVSVDNISDISALVRDAEQPNESPLKTVTFTLQQAGSEETVQQDWELPVIQETTLTNGYGFVTRFDGEAWQTMVTAVPDGAAQLEVGDQLVALMSTSEVLAGRTSLEDIINRETADGKNKFEFAISRGGSMWVVPMTYSNGA